MSVLASMMRRGGFRGFNERSGPRRLPGNWAVRDTMVAVVALLLCLVELEVLRSLRLVADMWSVRTAQGFIVFVAALSIFRRRLPLTIAYLIMGLFLIADLTGMGAINLLGTKAILGLVLFSAAGWAWPRRRAWIALGALTVGLLVAALIISGLSATLADLHRVPASRYLSPASGLVLYALLVNAMVCVLPLVAGNVTWALAQERDQVRRQARLIKEQSQALSRHAVLDERVRIARDLHDVAAHHVAGIGVHAAALRRTIEIGVDRTNPSAVDESLRTVEGLSWAAVTELRAVVGSLRDDGSDSESELRGLGDLPELVTRVLGQGVKVRHDVIEGQPGDLRKVPEMVSMSLYRVAQEALSNVVAHSSATEATLTVRVTDRGGSHSAEVEVLDRGSSRTGSSGSQRGFLGIAERIVEHGGDGEVGRRPDGGYRVRVRLPFIPVSEGQS